VSHGAERVYGSTDAELRGEASTRKIEHHTKTASGDVTLKPD
jgi:hypothetical protein